MARNANLHIRVDSQIKTSAEQLFSTFGITVTDAVNMFLHQSLLVGGIPFEVRQPRYNVETEAAMQETRDILAGKIQRKSYSSFGEYLADVKNSDVEV